jgi:hypothetical protein
MQETIMDQGFEDVGGVNYCMRECVFENHVFLEGLQGRVWCNFRAMRDGATRVYGG